MAGTVDLDSPESTTAIARVEDFTVHDLFHFEVATAIPTNDIAILRVRTECTVKLSGFLFFSLGIAENTYSFEVILYSKQNYI